MADAWGGAWATAWGDAWGAGGAGPLDVFKIGVVPVYVHPDPTAAGVVPVVFVAYAPGVVRVQTIPLAQIEAGCVPMREAPAGIGVVPVMEDV